MDIRFRQKVGQIGPKCYLFWAKYLTSLFQYNCLNFIIYIGADCMKKIATSEYHYKKQLPYKRSRLYFVKKQKKQLQTISQVPETEGKKAGEQHFSGNQTR